MVKIQRMGKVEAETIIKETPKRIVGEWKQLLTELSKTQEGAKITELTRGQVAALLRQSKVDGFTAVAVDKYSAVIITPPTLKAVVKK